MDYEQRCIDQLARCPVIDCPEMSCATHNGLSSRGPGAWPSHVAVLEVVRSRPCYTPHILCPLLELNRLQIEAHSQHGLDIPTMSRGAYALSAADPQK